MVAISVLCVFFDACNNMRLLGWVSVLQDAMARSGHNLCSLIKGPMLVRVSYI